MINTVVFDEAYREGAEPEPDDLGFHPLTGSICPGNLCQGSGLSIDRLMVPITLTDLHQDFTYRFRVRLKAFAEQQKLTSMNLKVYAIFDRGLKDGTCRVQSKRWSNFWVWAGPLQKFALFATVVVLSALLLRFSSAKEQ